MPIFMFIFCSKYWKHDCFEHIWCFKRFVSIQFNKLWMQISLGVFFYSFHSDLILTCFLFNFNFFKSKNPRKMFIVLHLWTFSSFNFWVSWNWNTYKLIFIVYIGVFWYSRVHIFIFSGKWNTRTHYFKIKHSIYLIIHFNSYLNNFTHFENIFCITNFLNKIWDMILIFHLLLMELFWVLMCCH